jgi:hypothetical protein
VKDTVFESFTTSVDSFRTSIESFQNRPEGFAGVAQGAKADSSYQKPTAEIPKTDLASAVQTSLDRPDTSVHPAMLKTMLKKRLIVDRCEHSSAN